MERRASRVRDWRVHGSLESTDTETSPGVGEEALDCRPEKRMMRRLRHWNLDPGSRTEAASAALRDCRTKSTWHLISVDQDADESNTVLYLIGEPSIGAEWNGELMGMGVDNVNVKSRIGSGGPRSCCLLWAVSLYCDGLVIFDIEPGC